MQRVTIPAKRQRVTVQEEKRNIPEVIEYFTHTQRLRPGSVTKGEFREALCPARRIPFSDAQIQILPGQSQATQVLCEFILGRPLPEMDGHRLAIQNVTKRVHRISARDGIHFGGIGAPLFMAVPAGTPVPSGGIFVDGESSGNTLSIGSFGALELFAFRRRWIITGGRHLKLS